MAAVVCAMPAAQHFGFVQVVKHLVLEISYANAIRFFFFCIG